jgi:hypothetical protein
VCCKVSIYRAQEVGGTFSGEDGLVIVAGGEYVEWYHSIHSVPDIMSCPPPPQPPLIQRDLNRYI